MSEKSKEEQQGRILEYQFFELVSFKVTEKLVTITHHEGGLEPITQITSSEHTIHPEFREKLDQLKVYASQIIGTLEGWDFCRDHLSVNNEDASKGAIEGHKMAVSRFSVGGFSFQGEGDTLGIKISGSLKTPKAGAIGMSLPKICFNAEKLGIEEEVEEICEEIKKEVYAYRFQGKKLQLDIVTEVSKKENPGLFVEPGDQKHGFDKNGEKDFDAGETLKDIKGSEKEGTDEEIV